MIAWVGGLAAAFCRRTSEAPPAPLVARETTGPAHTKIISPTAAELARIQEQTAVAERLAKAHGSELHGTLADLHALQSLVDAKVLSRTQTYELQSLGIALGRVMVNNSSLVWVTVEDEYGRDPALNVPGTSVLLFPLTMISKRVEQNRDVPLEALYKTTVANAERMAAEERAAGRPKGEG
jgi:hypothetical protein